ncbi:MAG: type II toxin-antitoxin system HicA family toxin [Chloroflexota bacterium]|nr:type II toxin-antitoxin system HicA family toxin [Chloroflexota bacterium]
MARTRGSHVILEHPDRKPLVIPRHGAVKPGLLLARVKDAGLTPEAFAELL